MDQGGQVLLGQAGPGAAWLGSWLRADEAILVASEFASNAVRHSASRHGGAFTLRAEVGRDRVRIEVEDAGGRVAWLGSAGETCLRSTSRKQY